VRTTGREKAPPERVLTQKDVLQLRSLCRDVAIAEPVMRYAARLVAASDPMNDDAPEIVRRSVRYGAGVRGAQSLVLAAKAVGLLSGRANVSFSDIDRVAKPALRHRLIRSFQGEADGVTPDQVVEAVVSHVPARPAEVDRASA
jgi:MoxR-like ATPase